jgi:hypothetical protein
LTLLKLRDTLSVRKLLEIHQKIHLIKSVFGSVVAVAFQITFRAEMHANDVFLFFKNYF